MNIKNINFSWISRLGKVIVLLSSVAILPIAFLAGSETPWDGNLSGIFLYTSLYILIGYLLLVLVSKTLLYIFRGDNFLKAGFTKKHYILFLAPVLLSLILSGLFYFIVEPIKEKRETRERETVFSEVVQGYQKTRELAFECVEREIDRYVENEKKSCNVQYQRIKNNYDICRIINNHDYCIALNDYREYDCSEKGLKDKAFEKSQLMKIQTIEMVSSYDDMYKLQQCYKDVVKYNVVIYDYLQEHADLNKIYAIAEKAPLETFSLYIWTLIENGKLDTIANKQDFDLDKFSSLVKSAIETETQKRQ